MKNIKSIVEKIFSSRIKYPITLIILAAVLFAGYKIFSNKSGKTTYQTTKVELGTIISTTSASGQVISSNLVSINTNASGIVSKVYVKEGDSVKAGQKILDINLDPSGKLKNTSAWSSYLSAKNSLDSAKTSLYSLDSQMWAANQKFINDAVARNLPTNDPTYIQQSDDWNSAESKYKNQQNAIAQSQANLNNAWLTYQLSSPTLVAPSDGVISSLTVAEGMIIGSGITSSTDSSTSQRVGVIQSPGNPLSSFNLSEVDVLKVKTGQKATISIDSLSDKTFTGKTVSIDRTGSITSGVTNYPVIIQFDTNAPDILPNMSATANIIIDRKDNVLLVPNGAIQLLNGQSTVRILKDGKEQSVTVETGISSDSQTEIISGLNENEEVIISSSTSTTATSSTSSPFGNVFGGRGGATFIRSTGGSSQRN